MNSFKRVRAFQIELEFGSVGFWGEGKTGVPGEKPLGARERTNDKLNPHMASTPGVEPGPHWWEASALTTAPPLLPSASIYESNHCHYKSYRYAFYFCSERSEESLQGSIGPLPSRSSDHNIGPSPLKFWIWYLFPDKVYSYKQRTYVMWKHRVKEDGLQTHISFITSEGARALRHAIQRQEPFKGHVLNSKRLVCLGSDCSSMELAALSKDVLCFGYLKEGNTCV